MSNKTPALFPSIPWGLIPFHLRPRLFLRPQANQGKTEKLFDTARALRLALAHLIQTLGKTARRVSEHSEIPWKEVIGMRHKIVHDYMAIDEDIVWEVVTTDLPQLIVGLERIIVLIWKRINKPEVLGPYKSCLNLFSTIFSPRSSVLIGL